MPYKLVRKHSYFVCVCVDSPNAKHSPSMYLTFIGMCSREHCALSAADYARRSSMQLLQLILQLLQLMGALAGAAKRRDPLVWGMGELGSTSHGEGRPQHAWLCAAPWKGEYVAPIIGSNLKGCQLAGYLPCEPLRIKERLFC